MAPLGLYLQKYDLDQRYYYQLQVLQLPTESTIWIRGTITYYITAGLPG